MKFYNELQNDIRHTHTYVCLDIFVVHAVRMQINLTSSDV